MRFVHSLETCVVQRLIEILDHWRARDHLTSQNVSRERMSGSGIYLDTCRENRRDKVPDDHKHCSLTRMEYRKIYTAPSLEVFSKIDMAISEQETHLGPRDNLSSSVLSASSNYYIESFRDNDGIEQNLPFADVHWFLALAQAATNQWQIQCARKALIDERARISMVGSPLLLAFVIEPTRLIHYWCRCHAENADPLLSVTHSSRPSSGSVNDEDPFQCLLWYADHSEWQLCWSMDSSGQVQESYWCVWCS